VLLTDRIRRRKSRGLFIRQLFTSSSFPSFFELVRGGLQFRRQCWAEQFFCGDLCEKAYLACAEEFRQPQLKVFDALDWNVIEISVLDGPQDRHLNGGRNGTVLWLLEDFHDALSAINLGLRFRI